MTRTRSIVLSISALCVGATGCISTQSDVLDATEGCDEYDDGTVDELDIDGDAKTFIEATGTIDDAVVGLSEDVFEACAAIATDLGAKKTWDDDASLKARISNDSDTGACDAAARVITDRLDSVKEADASLHVAVCEGECHVDFEEQRRCDADCATHTKCEPGTVETRCEPGKITAYCSGSCEADAYCVGTAEAAANCTGSCEARCEGSCKGTCYLEDGSVNEDDPECRGKCEGTCEGKCFGACRVDVQAGVECGADVRCRGGCTGEITEPSCTTEYSPPKCEVDTACYEACTTRVTENAKCDPTTVTITAHIEGNADLEAVVKTLEKHMPVFYRAARAEGKLIQHASERMADAGGRLADRVEDLDGKSLACVTKSSASLSESLDALNVSIDASIKIQGCVDVDSDAQ